MKHIALALIACAGLGLAARQPVLPSDSQRSEPGPAIILSEGPPVETPLVEKLLSKPAQPPKPTIADGQLSPRGEWRWSQAQGAWVPVPQPGPRWVENGHSATIDHLVRDHGYRRADLVKLTQYQLDTLHSNSHNSARARRVSAPTYCPSGRCPRR
jgi:hypothetical protein